MGSPWLLVWSDWVANLTRNATISPLGRSIKTAPSCQIPSRYWNCSSGSP